MADGTITQVKLSNNKIYDISLPGLAVTPSIINETVTDVQSFFADNALNRETLDTLKEIQTWMDTEGAAADALAIEVANKADKATTLSGYGITDAYTKSQIDSTVSTLNTAIGKKAASSHTHTIANVTNLQSTLDAKAAKTHTHAISDITGLEARLAAIEAMLISITDTEIDSICGASIASIEGVEF